MGYYDINKNIERAAWLVGIMLYLSVNFWAISVAMYEPDTIKMPIDKQIETMAARQGVSVEKLANTGHGDGAASGVMSREYLVSKARSARTPVHYAYEENENGFLEKKYWISADGAILQWKDLYEPSGIKMGFLQYDGVRDGCAVYKVDASGPIFLTAVAMLFVSFFAGVITLVIGIFLEAIYDGIANGKKNRKQNKENGI